MYRLSDIYLKSRNLASHIHSRQSLLSSFIFILLAPFFLTMRILSTIIVTFTNLLSNKWNWIRDVKFLTIQHLWRSIFYFYTNHFCRVLKIYFLSVSPLRFLSTFQFSIFILHIPTFHLALSRHIYFSLSLFLFPSFSQQHLHYVSIISTPFQPPLHCLFFSRHAMRSPALLSPSLPPSRSTILNLLPHRARRFPHRRVPSLIQAFNYLHAPSSTNERALCRQARIDPCVAH